MPQADIAWISLDLIEIHVVEHKHQSEQYCLRLELPRQSNRLGIARHFIKFPLGVEFPFHTYCVGGGKHNQEYQYTRHKDIV